MKGAQTLLALALLHTGGASESVEHLPFADAISDPVPVTPQRTLGSRLRPHLLRSASITVVHRIVLWTKTTGRTIVPVGTGTQTNHGRYNPLANYIRGYR